MPRWSKIVLLPKQERFLRTLGEQIKLARLRRNLPVEQLAQRAGIARTTLIRLEHGDGGAAISTLAKTLFALGLEQDILLIAKDDLMGYRMQDAGLLVKKRARSKNAK
ncbi:MAG: helix-turn-helix domain-containing protein [Fibromonadales bacterium]|nr:helix-turn-helix domain-containing protein [Fibromonadales bacterium]